jgi:hypothetical protein
LGDRIFFLKRSSPTPSSIASFFGNTMFYSKNDPHQIQLEEDLILFIVKELVPLFCQSIIPEKVNFEAKSSCFFSIKAIINE